MRTDFPLLISQAETSFQLSIPELDVEQLIRDGELLEVEVRGQKLILYDSLKAFIRRKTRWKARRAAVTSSK